MQIKILKDKKFHVPTDLIKEAERDAEEEETLRRRINAMTDEEYEVYVKTELEESDRQIANGEVTPMEEVEKELEEYFELLDRERENYESWKKALRLAKGEKVLRNIV